MAISQGSNLINVVVHNGADSRDASLRTIILRHVLIEGENCGSFLQEEAPPAALAVHLIPFISMEASSAICIRADDGGGGGRVGAVMSERSGCITSHFVNVRCHEARGRTRTRR